VTEGRLDFQGNGEVHYTIRGIHVRLGRALELRIATGVDLPPRRLSRPPTPRVEVRQGEKERYVPEVYVVPNGPQIAPPSLRPWTRTCGGRRHNSPELPMRQWATELPTSPFRKPLRVGHEGAISRKCWGQF